MRSIDHIVYAVPNLEDAVSKVHNLLGIKPSIGGQHITRGTKNALLNLGNQQYLELIARDHANTTFEGKAWMSVDDIIEPTITRWSLSSNDLRNDQATLAEFGQDRGQIFRGSRKTPDRKTLAWDMILPGKEDIVDIIPFMTDWSSSDIHPTDSLPRGLQLETLECYHPDPSTIQPIFDQLDIEVVIHRAASAKIKIAISSPNGIVTL